MIKKHATKILLFIVNMLMLSVGVLLIKEHEQNKQTANAAAATEVAAPQDDITSEAAELNQIIDKLKQQKTDSIANNPSQVTTRQPTTVTETIPGKTTTVKVPAGSSSSSSSKSSSTPKPSTTTKTS